MKKRIKIDSSILSFIIILTGLLYLFPQLYHYRLLTDDLFDFIGLLVVLSGTFLRMAARGYKKAHSNKSEELVTGGPYTLSRNPMYLGSFLMGAGFILIVWPFWTLIIFAGIFYTRFRRQIQKEETYLEKKFGEAYLKYTKKVPRIFPTWKNIRGFKLRKTFPPDVLWSTKEKYGLYGWPLLALVLECFQEKVVYGILDISNAFKVFLLSMVVFFVVIWVLYKNA